MARKVKILIVDDHAVFRHGLKDILEKHFPMAAFNEAGTGKRAIELVRETGWSIVILDVTMPGQNGIEILLEIRKIQPALPVLILSMHPEEQYALRLLEAGADGYITKMKAPLDIAEAVRQVLAGGKYMSPALVDRQKEQLKSGAKRLPHDRLSQREYQVMRMTVSGKSLKETAGELFISIQTVSTHRVRIQKKMELHSTVELIRYALENGLV